ncbi:hypothetical protein HDU84_006798 [Entophlyctis sp. JEL0112]|nr:hypothetical protein HDU84_006798 [Entophlyctis sp. JEL0112]
MISDASTAALSTASSSPVTKRLQSELMQLMVLATLSSEFIQGKNQMSSPPGVSAFPESESLLSWIATIEGPAGTAYEGLAYKLSMKFPLNYPYNAPTVRFETPIFHPNVDTVGNICLDILKDKWSAVYNVQTVLLSLQSLLEGAIVRLRKEYKQLHRNPVPFIDTKPLESNLLEWHYLITGPDDSPYKGGMYWGKLTFPPDYPFSPPSIQMITPSGRFKPSVRLCLSMSDYHPETWCPGWNVGAILTGLLSFMLEDTQTQGSIQTTLEEKQELAAASLAWNKAHSQFTELFPEI